MGFLDFSTKCGCGFPNPQHVASDQSISMAIECILHMLLLVVITTFNLPTYERENSMLPYGVYAGPKLVACYEMTNICAQ